MIFPWTIMSRNTRKILRNSREMLAKIKYEISQCERKTPIPAREVMFGNRSIITNESKSYRLPLLSLRGTVTAPCLL